MQDGAKMVTHFYGTTRTWAGDDNDQWLLLTQENVLYVPALRRTSCRWAS
jgi:hypothetical protein